MKLIIGLGNPGKKYEGTRHNVGFVVVDALASRITDSNTQITGGVQKYFNYQKRFNSDVCWMGNFVLAKPQTFMNASGAAVAKLATFYKLSATDIYVIHDDLDIKLGEYKIQKGVGPKLHYGVESIEKALGTKDFWRIRVGAENREIIQNQDGRTQKIPGEKYVLHNFTSQELDLLDGTIGNIINYIMSLGKNDF